jgi:hypothetical protein
MHMKPHIKKLLSAALLAPSGDNLQPWRVVLDSSSDRIGIILDPSRDQSPMNSGQRMSRIAIGAMLENIVQLADAMRLSLEIEMCPGGKDFLIVVTVSGEVSTEGSDFFRFLGERVSNRRVYDGRPVPEDLQKKLQGETGNDDFKVHWVFEKEKLQQLGELLGKSDACMFSSFKVRKSFIGTVRFDLPRNEGAEHGLSLGSLEAGTGDVIGLRLLKYMPDFLFKAVKAGDKISDAAKNFIHSSSGLCVISQPEISDRSDIRLGQLMQRVWLCLGKHGLAVQPMNSMVILSNMKHYNQVPAGIDTSEMLDLLKEFNNHFPELDNNYPGFIFRFGYAAPPTAKNKRLSLDMQVVEGTV